MARGGGSGPATSAACCQTVSGRGCCCSSCLRVCSLWSLESHTKKQSLPSQQTHTRTTKQNNTGSLLLLGRADLLQAKVAGARVDLLAAERALAPALATSTSAASTAGDAGSGRAVGGGAVAAVALRAWPRPRRPQDSVIAAYAVPAAGGDGAAAAAQLVAALRAAAERALPPAARPASYTLLAALPRSPAGKLLRSQLPPPPGYEDQQLQQEQEEKEQSAAQPAQPASTARPRPPPSESDVMAAFVTALGGAAAAAAARLEATSDFFAHAGGDSLAAAAVAAALGVDARLVFACPTARSLAAALGRPAAAAAAGAAAAAAGGPAQAAEAAEGLFPAAKRRRLVVEVAPAGSASGAGALPAGGGIEVVWRQPLGECVDAAPRLARLPLLAGAAAPTLCVLACSHAGQVGCFQAARGARVWGADWPDCRCDAGLAVAPGLGEVAVATRGGELRVLCCRTGAARQTVALGGEPRAAPAVDPWRDGGAGGVGGWWWLAAHGAKQLTAVEPSGGSGDLQSDPVQSSGRRILRLALPAACSAAVAFSRRRRRAFAALLDGSVCAVDVVESGSGAGDGGAGAGGSSAAPALQLAWRDAGHAAPVFSAPVAVAPRGGGRPQGQQQGEEAEEEELLIVGHVDGLVRALPTADGGDLGSAGGSAPALRWSVQLPGGQLFADLVPIGGGARPAVLAATHAGALHCLDAARGARLWSLDLGAGPISAAPAVAGGAIVVCCSGGALLALRGDGDRGDGSSLTVPSQPPRLLSCAQMPGELFSSPAAVVDEGAGGAAPSVLCFFGCRDDHLYCVRASLASG